MQISSAHIHVHGKVQGVGYRWFVAQHAELLAIKGWVQNLPDGTVQCLVEGSQQNIELLIEHCKQGPVRSAVTTVEVQWLDPQNNFTEFRIAR